MNDEEMPLEEFILLPDTIALVLSNDDYTSNYINNHPYIRTGTVLSGDQTVCYISDDKYEELFEDMGPYIISMIPTVMGPLDRVNLEASGIIQTHEQPYLNLTGKGVLLGFIDTGIDYTNEVFKYEDGTSKIKYIWDQTITGNPPKDFYFGTEYSDVQINEALKSEDPLKVVPHQDTVGHGTFLASIARR